MPWSMTVDCLSSDDDSGERRPGLCTRLPFKTQDVAAFVEALCEACDEGSLQDSEEAFDQGFLQDQSERPSAKPAMKDSYKIQKKPSIKKKPSKQDLKAGPTAIL